MSAVQFCYRQPTGVTREDEATVVTSNDVRRAAIRAAAVLALCVSLAACTGEEAPTENSAAAVGNPDACKQVDAPMQDIPTSDTEPQMRIPQPPGWERSTEFDNDITRFALLGSDSSAPQNIVTVSLGILPEPADGDMQTILDDLKTEMITVLDANDMRTNYVTTATTVCGQPARVHTSEGSLPGRTVTGLHVVTQHEGNVYWAQVVVGIKPDNSTYKREADTIVSGFQMVPPRPDA